MDLFVLSESFMNNPTKTYMSPFQKTETGADRRPRITLAPIGGNSASESTTMNSTQDNG